MQKIFDLFRARFFILISGMFIFGLVLCSRLLYLYMFEFNEYLELSEHNRIRLKLEPATRGRILDCNNKVISQDVYVKTLISKTTNEPELEHLITVLNKHHFDINQNLLSKKNLSHLVLKKSLNWEETAFIESYKNDFANLELHVTSERSYTLKEKTPHFIGNLGRIGEKHPFYKKMPFMHVGQSGLEKILEDQLSGKPSVSEEEVNATSESVRTLSYTPSVSGQDLVLSIDLDVQSYIYSLLEPHRSGAGIVMDVNTGELKALVSCPAKNTLNALSKITSDQWKELIQDSAAPLLDKTTQGLYPTGSLIKPLMAIVALEEKIIVPETRFFCPGHISIAGKDIYCWKDGGHGSVNLTEALRGSCNVYFYEIAKRLAPTAMIAWYKKFGLGEKTGVEAIGEKAGLLPTPEWKKKTKKDRWRVMDSVYMSIGQGYLLCTPLQMARMIAACVNNGRLVRPTLIAKKAPSTFPSIGVNPNHLNLVRKAFGEVMNSPLGTGYRNRPQGVSWLMGGKSGTAQVRKITAQDRKLRKHHGNDWEWKDKDHSWFVGFAPLDNPKYIVVVLVEHGGFGGVTAGPIGRDILMYLFK